MAPNSEFFADSDGAHVEKEWRAASRKDGKDDSNKAFRLEVICQS
jgi:hypothetical protein